MNQYLVCVELRKRNGGEGDGVIGRVSPEARMVDVITSAKVVSLLEGDTRCVNIEILGDLEPHLFTEYIELGAR